MPKKDPRLSALNIVCRSLTGNKDLQEALDHELQSLSSQRDKALVTELAYGYLRYRGRIDYALEFFLDKPGKLSFRLKVLLGLAVYELFFLDRVPEYATVSRTVALCRRLFGPKMSGLVNAVLRKISGLEIFSEKLFQKDNPHETVFWSRYYSCPVWIVRMWAETYGKKLCLEYLRQSLDKPPLGIRLGKTGLSEVDSGCVARRLGNSILIKDSCRATEIIINKGTVARQSFAAQQVMHELGMPHWEQPVWDMCAGNGGKTFLMLDQGMKVFSSDVSLKRLSNLKNKAGEFGCEAHVFAASGRMSPLRIFPSTILIDAPCTGLGVLSRRPDIKWKRTPEDVTRLARIQTGLLQSAAVNLKDQGRMVYLTCTLSPDENERRIKGFLDAHNGFMLEKMFVTDIEQGLKETFFGAVMRKG